MNAEYLKKAKKDKKMTLQQIAEKSNIPKRTVDDIFSGKTPNPRIDTLQAIEKALGLNQPSLEWTEADQAQGIGRYPTYLSSDEKEWLELRSLILSAHGDQYLETVISMLNAITK